MKRLISVAIVASATPLIGLFVLGGSQAQAGGIGNIIFPGKGSHDICIGTLDPSGVQHPLICINLPVTTSGF